MLATRAKRLKQCLPQGRFSDATFVRHVEISAAHGDGPAVQDIDGRDEKLRPGVVGPPAAFPQRSERIQAVNPDRYDQKAVRPENAQELGQCRRDFMRVQVLNIGT